ncbi:GNAT family protein [Streptomyces sp. RB17]|uniref:GNAT family N-acetyltransferase n=1 Tax=Streptomyces sp. RB17 TaxID=2585197 RepID=UPI002B21D323|nr:GNAT family protein [Streptomyces sp. RB17]
MAKIAKVTNRRGNTVDRLLPLVWQCSVIHGEKIALRARQESDVPVLQSELYDDVATRSRADSRPWRPIPQGSAQSPYAVAEPSDDAACFSVVELESRELVGEALLWDIDTHNRTAHIGISLRPAFRGRGLGVDVLQTLCEYGFAVRGLQRLQIETLTDNTPMIAAAARAGFTREGTLRHSAWVYGAYADEAILGLLAHDWTPRAQSANTGAPRTRSG